MPSRIPEDHLLEISNGMKADNQLGSAKEKLLISSTKITGQLPKHTLTHLRHRRKVVGIALGAIMAVLSISGFVGWKWLDSQIIPMDVSSNEAVLVTVESGMTPGQIANLLEEKGLIRNSFVFDIYTRLTSTRNRLQAGVFKLYKRDSLPDIVTSLVDGKAATISVQLLPGDTLTGHKDRLLKLGYSSSEIDIAFNSDYSDAIFTEKPSSAGLEGYIYGETYFMPANASVKEILERTFSEFEAVVVDNDLKAKFAKQGLSLYEGITMASIIQREMKSPSGSVPSDDQRQVAQVFYTRLRMGMPLGSDVTYQYIADKLGVARDPKLDNPYNTRKYAGLPPGPISSPGITALLAAANPADGDYLYFLSGDDGITYFAKNDYEHQQNIINHCQQKCSIL